MPERDWSRRGALLEDERSTAVAVSAEGYGLLGAVAEPDTNSTAEQLRRRRARLLRVTSSGVEQVYESTGWIQALDSNGMTSFAVAAALKASGSGSDYQLLASFDGGQSWEPRGNIPASSVGQVLGVTGNEIWVLGAYQLAVTLNGGSSWRRVDLAGDRNPNTERMRRLDRSVFVLGGGIAVTTDAGVSWSKDPLGGARVHDASGRLLVATREGRVRLGRNDGQAVSWFGTLPDGRLPLRIATNGDAIRVLTRAAAPAHGASLVLYRSEDGGKGWTGLDLDLRPEATDLAGDCGLGVDVQGNILGPL